MRSLAASNRAGQATLPIPLQDIRDLCCLKHAQCDLKSQKNTSLTDLLHEVAFANGTHPIFLKEAFVSTLYLPCKHGNASRGCYTNFASCVAMVETFLLDIPGSVKS